VSRRRYGCPYVDVSAKPQGRCQPVAALLTSQNRHGSRGFVLARSNGSHREAHAHSPAVKARDHGPQSPPLPVDVIRETPAATAPIGGRCPWLGLGWDYVRTPEKNGPCWLEVSWPMPTRSAAAGRRYYRAGLRRPWRRIGICARSECLLADHALPEEKPNDHTMDFKNQTRNLSDHPGLQVLLPHYRNYAVRGVGGVQAREAPLPCVSPGRL
jgi:hypothetical protein